MMKRGGTIKLAGAIFTAVALFLLMPCLSYAGNLEPPSGPPLSTMKTLDEIPPTWSQKLPCDSTTNCPRFELVMDGAAVLDKETGLVWQKMVYTSSDQWGYALYGCNILYLGDRYGWRLPTIHELLSLFVNTGPGPFGNLVLPSGHPFTNVQSPGVYWSATTRVDYPSSAWIVTNGGKQVVQPKTDWAYSWCVRGGQGVDNE